MKNVLDNSIYPIPFMDKTLTVHQIYALSILSEAISPLVSSNYNTLYQIKVES